MVPFLMGAKSSVQALVSTTSDIIIFEFALFVLIKIFITYEYWFNIISIQIMINIPNKFIWYYIYQSFSSLLMYSLSIRFSILFLMKSTSGLNIEIID